MLKKEQLSISMKNTKGDTPFHILCFQPYTSPMNNALDFYYPSKLSKTIMEKFQRIKNEIIMTLISSVCNVF